MQLHAYAQTLHKPNMTRLESNDKNKHMNWQNDTQEWEKIDAEAAWDLKIAGLWLQSPLHVRGRLRSVI